MENSRESHGSWNELLLLRGIDLSQYSISPETEIWLQEHVSSSTLLTKEELMYSQRATLTSPNLKAGSERYIPDVAYEAAITTLHASIASIEQQSTILESHKQALLSIRKSNKSHDVEQAAKANAQKLTKDRAQLDLDLEHAVATIRTDLKSQTTRIDNVISSAMNNIKRTLDKDDRALDDLQKVVPRLHAEDDDASTIEALDILCSQWKFYELQATRNAVDDTYDNALRKALRKVNGAARSSDHTTEIAAVRAELDELSNEIDGLIGLVGEHYHRSAIVKFFDSARRDNDTEVGKWSEYVACVLLYLTARLETYYDLYRHSHVYKALLATLELEVDSADLEANPDAKSGQTRDARQGGKGLKPLRLVQANYNDNQDAAVQVLKLLNVKPPANMDTTSLNHMLGQLLHTRTTNAAAQSAKTAQQYGNLLTKSISSSDEHVRFLHEAVMSDTETSQIRLLSPEIDEAIHSLQAETDKLASKMQDLDIDELGKQLKALI